MTENATGKPAGFLGGSFITGRSAPTPIVQEWMSRRNGLRLVGVAFTAGAGFLRLSASAGFCNRSRPWATTRPGVWFRRAGVGLITALAQRGPPWAVVGRGGSGLGRWDKYPVSERGNPRENRGILGKCCQHCCFFGRKSR